MGRRWAGCGFVVCAAIFGSVGGVNKICAFNSTTGNPSPFLVNSSCVSNPACRGPDPDTTAGCPSYCTEIPDDAGTFLGATIEIRVDVVVVANGTTEVARGSTFVDARFGVVTPSELASLTLTPVGAADEIHGNTNTTFTVEVTYTPIKATYDRTALDAANKKLACFGPPPPSPPPSPQFTQPPPTTYSAVFWAPGVDPFPPGSTSVSNFSLGGCPAPGTVTDATVDPGVELFSCFPADPRLETCTELRRCTALERQTNAATRTKTQNVECETLTTCDSGARFQVAAPTATTDRVCVDRVETCSLDAGQITADPGNLTAASTCADVEPCGADGDAGKTYTATGATSVTQPVCLDVKTCGDVGDEFESAAPELEKDRACSRVLAACDSTPTVVSAVRNTLSDGVVPTPVDFYESAVPTATTDRVCTPATVCLEHETLDAQLTPTTDRTCRTRDACSGSGSGSGSSCPPPGAPPAPPSSPPDGLPALIWGSVSLVLGAVWVVNANIASGNVLF
jgi:hypothetical protein